MFLRRWRSMLWINALRDEGSYSSPFFFRTATTNFLIISCRSSGVISSISLFSSLASIYSLKTFISYKVCFFAFSFFKSFCKLFNFFVADGRKPAQHAVIRLNSKRDARNQFNKKKKAGIVTSLNDTTLTKVTYGKYATRVPDEVTYGIYEWFRSQ